MRRCVLASLLPAILLLAMSSRADTRKVHGFVTAFHSPTRFEIDEYKIIREPAQPLEIERFKSVPATAAVSFKPEDIRVGTELEVEGDYNSSTHELKAQSVKVFLLDTVVVDRTAQLEKMPELEKNASGAWHGLIFADGQCVVVTDSISITVAAKLNEVPPATAERLDQEKAASKADKPNQPGPNNPAPVPFTSLYFQTKKCRIMSLTSAVG